MGVEVGVGVSWTSPELSLREGVEALSGPLSWFSPSGFSSDMGNVERLVRGMSQLEKINLHM